MEPLAVSSIPLMLQSMGVADPVESITPKPFIEIVSPRRGEILSSGELLVRGETLADPSKALRAQLVDRDGRLLAQRLARIQPDSQLPGVANAFETTLTFKVNQLTRAWLVIFLNDGPGAEITHLARLPVILTP
jgi:hypothetical protein